MKPALAMVVLFLLVPAARAEMGSWPKRPLACQILDVQHQPPYACTLAYIPPARVGDGQKSAFLEADASAAFGYYRTRQMGDVDLRLEAAMIGLTDATGWDLPRAAGRLALDAGWTFRDNKGGAFQFRVAPGLQTDFATYGGDAWYLPFSGALVHTFHPALSGIFGFQVRPGYHRLVMPLIGVEWAVVETVRVKAQLPESRIEWFVTQDTDVHAGFEWRSVTYGYEDDDGRRFDRVDFQDYLWTAGVARRLSDDLQVSGDLGYVSNRRVAFDGEGRDHSESIENQVMFRIGFAGPF